MAAKNLRIERFWRSPVYLARRFLWTNGAIDIQLCGLKKTEFRK
jgi:hypothetical protein